MNDATTYVNLKQLREEFPQYIEAVAQGRSFTVVKRSKPIFRLTPVHEEGEWETIADFTSISAEGVSADELLKAL